METTRRWAAMAATRAACQPRSYHGPDLACDHLDAGAWSPAVCAWSPAEGEAEAPQDAISDEAVAAMLEAEEESAEAATATATAGPAAAIEWRDLDKGRFFFFMPATSVCVRVIVYPFGLIKTRMQSAGGNQYTSIAHAIRTIVKTEGPTALYKGFWVYTVSMLVGPIYLSSFEFVKQLTKDVLAGDSDIEVPAVLRELTPSAKVTLSAAVGGCLASFTSQTLVVPIDVVTQKLMTEQSKERVPPSRIIRDVWRKAGLRGFYRGYLTSLSTNAPSSMMMWPLYGRFKSVLRQALIAAVPSVSPENEDPDTSRRWKGYLSVAIVAPFAGAMAGGTTALVTNPLDVIRTRQQLQEGVDLGFRGVVRQLFDEAGAKGLLRGATARMLAMSVSLSVIFPSYELLMRLSRRDEEKEEEEEEDDEGVAATKSGGVAPPEHD